MAKSAVLLFAVVFALSTLTVTTVQAQSSVPKPSVPDFTVKWVDKSYDVPATTTSVTDPHANETRSTKVPTHHVSDIAIAVTVKNQPRPPSFDGNATTLYYNVRSKGHFEQNWEEKVPPSQYYYPVNLFRANSSSEYSVFYLRANYPVRGEVDYQVEAILGYTYTHYLRSLPPQTSSYFVYSVSGWSGTQNVTIPNTPTVSPNVLNPLCLVSTWSKLP